MLLMTAAARRLRDPWRAHRIGNRRHASMTLGAVNAFGKMHVALAIGHKAGMARVTGVAPHRCQRSHVQGVGSVDRP